MTKNSNPWDGYTMSARQAAKELRMGLNQVYQAVKAGELDAIRFGDRIHILTAPLKRKLMGE